MPSWDHIAAKLSESGDPPAVRMIDGLPAFPDEIPEDGWKELRIGLAGTMLTLRRTADAISVVTWGSTDPVLEAARNRLVQSLLDLGGTLID
ncbi:MAG TPA: hypothetical protein VGJ05_00805 [Fimbriiglobus sp.]